MKQTKSQDLFPHPKGNRSINSNLISVKLIKDLLKRHQIHPSKKLGQNFLVNKKVLQKIIKAAHLQSWDIVLEVGPGTGTLTKKIAKRVKKVVTVEKDQKIIEILNEELELIDIKNVEIVQGDILKIPNSQLSTSNPYKIVANLPYYITSPLIRKFLEIENQPKLMVLMVQKEVAQRISAQPPHMNLLAISVQFYAKTKIVSFVSKKSFWPQPKVDSAIIKIVPYFNKYNSDKLFTKKFFQLVKAGFSQPRKQILNNLSKMLNLDKEKTRTWLLKNNICPSQRAEKLTIKDWLKLSSSFN